MKLQNGRIFLLLLVLCLLGIFPGAAQADSETAGPPLPEEMQAAAAMAVQVTEDTEAGGPFPAAQEDSISSGNPIDYASVKQSMEKEKQQIIPRCIAIGDGTEVSLLGISDTLFIAKKETVLRSSPEEEGEALVEIPYGEVCHRSAVCENGWSYGTVSVDGEEREGYILNDSLSMEQQIEETEEEKLFVLQDTELMDFPARKDGSPVEILPKDTVVLRTGVIQGFWSRVTYPEENLSGFVPSYLLGEEKSTDAEIREGEEPQGSAEFQEDGVAPVSGGQQEAGEGQMLGTIHKSVGEGVFAEAIEGVTQEIGGDITVPIMGKAGAPVAVSAGAKLRSLGVFKVTHYCSCPICCGAYSNGITATGTVCTTNRTIAVNPKQIPYGSKIVINGQVYVAEDCGSAIRDNCIDIYVGTHEEGLARGVLHVEVFLLLNP